MSTEGAAGRAQPTLSIQLLGDVQIIARGVDVTAAIRYRKGLALLGYLATQHGRQHPREQIADLLWPDLDMVAARTNLRQILIPLAQVLNRDEAAPILVATKNSIGLFPRADTEIDLDAIVSLADTAPSLAPRSPEKHEFERRLSLIRGEFMAGLTLPDCEEFEEWLQHTRRTFHVRATVFLERLCVRHEADGQLSLAILVAERLTALDVWNEPHQRLLMRLLARSGQHGAALAVFDSLSENLRRQLDIEPDAQTRNLHAEILAESLVIRAQAPDSGTVPTSSERRWITVLCCEVHSGTADAEQAADQCGEMLAQAVEHLRAADACTLPPMGRHLVAYFGEPHAHEEAARRAALAALHIQRNALSGTTVRLGIASGIALVQTVAGVARPIGEVTETAIHLRLMVDEGEIAIGESTVNRIEAHCQLDPLGVRHLRGATTPLAVYRLTGFTDVPRVEERSSLAPLCGRAAEMSILTTLWKSARMGNRPIALLIGDAGIGKTRLVHELATQAKAAGAVVHSLGARPESAARPFAPLAHWLENSAEIRADDEPTRRKRRLRSYLDGIFDRSSDAPLCAALTALICSGDPDANADTAVDLHARSSAALIELFARLAGERPTLICFEEAQWADTSTLELLPRILAARAMVVVTVRPEGIPPGLPDDIVPLILRPLDATAGGTLAATMAHGSELPQPKLHELLGIARGNPLSIEEFSKAAQRPNAPAALPASFFELLQAQLDRIGTLKSLLQTAAVMGQQFLETRLARLVEATDLSNELGHACRSGLIVECGLGEYRFRHVLMREVIYLTLPRPRRRALHARIHKQLSESAATPIEERAYHLENAGDYSQAAQHWQAAGLLALDRRFTAEAIAGLERALKLYSLGAGGAEFRNPLLRHLAEARAVASDYASRQANSETSLR